MYTDMMNEMDILNNNTLTLSTDTATVPQSTDEPTVPLSIDWQYFVIELLIGIVSFFGNLLVLYAIFSRRYLRRHISNLYIACLAAADCVVGGIVCPFAILNNIGLPKNYEACLLMQAVLIACAASSIYCLLAVSFDRWLAVTKPLR